MKAYVDKDNCVACKHCVSVCPSVYSMDSDGKAVAIRDNIPVDDKNKATRSIINGDTRNCYSTLLCRDSV